MPQHFPNALEHVYPEMWETATVGICLLVTGSDPTMTETTLAQVLSTATECADTNYARKTFDNLTLTSYTGYNRRLEADSVTWTSLGGTEIVIGAVTYIDGASDAARYVLDYYDEFTGQTVGGDVTFSITSLYEFEYSA